MKRLKLIVLILVLALIGCQEDDSGSENIGQSAAEATENSLATSIARQSENNDPTATALGIGSDATATNTPAPVFPTASYTPVIANTFTPTFTAQPTEDILPTEVAAATVNDLQGDHFWLVRPFIATNEIKDASESAYRFGSTANGRYQMHHGVDIGNPQGTVVLSTASGIVLFAGNDFTQQTFGPSANFYGNHVVIAHTVNLPDSGAPLTFYTLYGHLSEIFVDDGQQVGQQQEIGLVGMTGVAIGPHLHLEVRMGESPYDYTNVYNPDLWMQPYFGYGVLVGRVSTNDGLLEEVEVLAVSKSSNQTFRTFTYSRNNVVKSDPFFAENFVLPDLPAGDYQIRVAYNGRIAFSRDITIAPDQSTYVNAQIQ